MPYAISDANLSSGDIKTTGLAVQPGENEIVYSVTVTYYIR